MSDDSRHSSSDGGHDAAVTPLRSAGVVSDDVLRVELVREPWEIALEVATAAGTVAAVVAAVALVVWQSRRERRSAARRDAASIIVDVEFDPPLDRLVRPESGAREVHCWVKVFSDVPIRNVRGTLSWAGAELAVDQRGRSSGDTAVLQARHMSIDGNTWWPVWASPGPDANPQQIEWSVSWQDRWGGWWRQTLGGSLESIGDQAVVPPDWPVRGEPA